ncbi:hypothetical protein Tco_0190709 [Tanacetum coccineum]
MGQFMGPLRLRVGRERCEKFTVLHDALSREFSIRHLLNVVGGEKLSNKIDACTWSYYGLLAFGTTSMAENLGYDRNFNRCKYANVPPSIHKQDSVIIGSIACRCFGYFPYGACGDNGKESF